MLLVQWLLKSQSLREARAEFQTLLELDPTDRDSLRRWFAGNPP
jgi:hypothetical protein